MYRRNGCQFPLHKYQILSWILELSSLAEVLLILVQQFSFNLKLTIYVTESSTFIILVFFTVWVTLSHPEASSIKISQAALIQKRILNIQKYPQWCNICRASVQITTKHCASCNRCIQGFDHHCNWVNNCIGSKNYKQFFLLVLIAWFRYFLHTILHIYAVCLIFQKKFQPVFDRQEFSVVSIVIFGVISVIQSSSVTLLLGFHLYFYKKKITTFQWILSRKGFQIQVQPQEEKNPKENSTVNQSASYQND